MRVLMFGWEFPPNISGGLGTACLGLTQSLVPLDVDLMFVVPRLFGNEVNGAFRLVSASEVVLPFAEEITNEEIRKESAPPPKKIQHPTVTPTVASTPLVRKEKSVRSFTQIEVESALMPYRSPVEKHITYPIETWNYQVISIGTSAAKIEPEVEEEELTPEKPGYKISFSGRYSETLLDEVNAYATVATELGATYQHDIIHVHDWMTIPAGIAAKKVSGQPLFLHVHSTEFDRSGSLSGPVYDIELEGLKMADKIVAVSEWTRNILINHYHIEPDKIAVVHNGIIARNGADIAYGESLGSHIVTFLGRVTHQKGPSYFVEAARIVSTLFPDAHFIIAGSGDLLPQTIERVAQLRLSSRFHFTGFLNTEWIRKIWSMSSVYVMPSVSEPFGITPLEAIQAGVPVIVSNQSGVAEVMPHALKVDFWDIEALAESICSVLRYKSLSFMLKTKGEQEIENLSWTKAAAKIKDLYEEIAP
jgi:glycogen synthase